MLYILIIILLIGLDQLSKIWVLNNLVDVSTIPIINNVFHLTYVENRGAAFGLLQNNQWIFIIVALLATVFGLYYLNTRKVHIFGRLGIILIISGALGNLVDRVRLGFVVDYFDFRVIWEYVFNVADVFVVVGTVFLCIYVLFFESKSR
ncbi:TPA: signal peptidase II [Clostridioides difficile]|uniref:signal peptidase II n=3 Tax=Clostridioides difficile TaxID=1496 RepID=UPI00038C65C3|nr:signal peptidase II [Clostridioides difficile]AUA29908.1 lipoprotein signal peptidase [Clostridioides difficile]EAA0000001.1 signal peptidase II [Clostridioides difficile]EGT3729478.1 signal peptidase II [Clostridioides difficile]EGT3731470.1 signal peptidase II [Clostridioides difficile]EGT3769889.1 signal peptidase II [Clostridioides difficile]